ncbi:hypothetical protein [Synechococcus sp. UW179A]|uniref:hypothetical protein n=1 Tax=Synechococcus sp. UW179A TaxID=2575510 RepID=UPI000E0E0F7C|nr:hypothetical protein [Synechococcus sp. UW179A]
MKCDWGKCHAVLIGDRWIQVRDGEACEGDVSFEIGGGVSMIASVSAIAAVKIAYQPEAKVFEAYTPWGTK